MDPRKCWAILAVFYNLKQPCLQTHISFSYWFKSATEDTITCIQSKVQGEISDGIKQYIWKLLILTMENPFDKSIFQDDIWPLFTWLSAVPHVYFIPTIRHNLCFELVNMLLSHGECSLFLSNIHLLLWHAQLAKVNLAQHLLPSAFICGEQPVYCHMQKV